ncbi:PadR family transcriptional regulator [Rathayibacter iranicus]|uniref:PadR family transcriptional regulator n=2 Tax=Rathayibacter iranicus TaxID=59737 RepID=A0AAD1AFC6_9MICO|nr:PadR family transcriptional regulator [Rathayibacter iranicus]MWV29835.1 hypothetical protein [Rathayibacter iranicus NCPPB 2253 = VKM Ac-1602]PPI41225.1 hypothetical protein C5E09_14830 [Rathayibacter iranicus]PPI57471.1 hypothetical protein C5E08_15720 [Rathayibacter iranicus]PPI68217.1 hypothetical protein C5E01_14770 [Rathayibacter iranicus]
MTISSTRLLVLGVVRLRRPVHGYEIQRELESWNADQWASIARGSVYNQLRSLSKDRFVSVVAVEKKDTRPSRHLFQVTPSGAIEFARLLDDIL